MTQTLVIDEAFSLECGAKLPGVTIAYTIHGHLNAERNNVVWICHAFTANSDPSEWWSGLVGDGKFFDPEKYCIICANVLGSCYGTTGPDSQKQKQQHPTSFPLITIRDIVKAHRLLRRHLGIDSIHCCIGGSMGGQQVLEWAIQEPNVFENIVAIACGAVQSPWARALNAAQRLALEADLKFRWKRSDATGEHGLMAARAIALLSYRNYDAYCLMQKDSGDILQDYRAESYLRHQGWKLTRRFTAESYWCLTKAMDSHDVGRKRGGSEQALHGIQARALIVGISSDILFPTSEQQELAACIPDARYRQIDSAYGHDGFLIEYRQLTALLEEFLPARVRRQVTLSELQLQEDL